MLSKFFIYCIIALVTFSCSQSNNGSNHSKETKKIPFIDTFSIRLDFLPYNIQVDAGLSLSSDSITILRSELKDAEWDVALEYFKPNFDPIAELWGVILYIDKSIKKHDSVETDDILGFQVYYILPGNVLYHRFYLLNENSQFDEYTRLTCETQGIDCASKTFIENELLNYRNVSKFNYSQLFLYPHDAKTFEPNSNSRHEIVDKLRSDDDN